MATGSNWILKFFFIFSVTLLIGIFSNDFFIDDIHKVDDFENEIVQGDENNLIDFDSVNGLTTKKMENVDSLNLVDNAGVIPLTIPNPKKQIEVLSKHTIVRVEQLSNSFDQGKIFVTVDTNLTSDQKLFLCQNIAKRHKEFSNVIICLYSNDLPGESLAKGNEEMVNVEEKRNSWLAMYSNNSVEGEYFDDNPGMYLGDFK